MVVSQVIALNVGKLCLVGRPGERGLARLDYVRQQCLQEIAQAIYQECQSGITLEQTQLSGIGLRIYQQLEQATPETSLYNIADSLKHTEPASDTGKKLKKTIEAEALDSCIPLQLNLDSLHEFDVIIAATNSTDRELIRPDMVKPDAIVCCTSIPSNLSRQFNQNDSTQLAFDGGLAKLPEDSQINFVGMPTEGLAYGCMAETLLLGFDGQNHSFCKGTLSAAQVYRTIELAELHGFALGDLKLDDQRLTSTTQLKKSA
jgi:hypothetical protein